MSTSLSEYISITGIESVSKNGITIYPNPGNNELNILLPDDLRLATEISLYSVDGRLVKNFISQTDALQNINTSELNAGMYQIIIRNGGEYFAFRWVKK
jgi:hypothetical protein